MIKASVRANVLHRFVEIRSQIGGRVPANEGVWFPTFRSHSGALRTRFEGIAVLPELPRGPYDKHS